MVTEIKFKCYTCLNPIALADLASCPGIDLVCCNTLDHPRIAHRLHSIIEYKHTSNRSQTYTKETIELN